MYSIYLCELWVLDWDFHDFVLCFCSINWDPESKVLEIDFWSLSLFFFFSFEHFRSDVSSQGDAAWLAWLWLWFFCGRVSGIKHKWPVETPILAGKIRASAILQTKPTQQLMQHQIRHTRVCVYIYIIYIHRNMYKLELYSTLKVDLLQVYSMNVYNTTNHKSKQYNIQFNGSFRSKTQFLRASNSQIVSWKLVFESLRWAWKMFGWPRGYGSKIMTWPRISVYFQ